MKIYDFWALYRIIFHFQWTNKAEIMDNPISLFADDERVRDYEKLREAFHKRGKIMSTAIGNGFAILHAKTNEVMTTFDFLQGERRGFFLGAFNA